ncbi:MAG: ABC transporter permease, partial [Weissella cibaria]
MNFVKRAGITLWARKGRSLLLVLTSTVILVFVMAGLIIQNAALTAANNAANAVGSTVSLSANREKMFEQMKASQSSASSTSNSETKPTAITMPTATVKQVKKIAALANVSSYNITNNASVNADSFKAVTTTTTSNAMGGGPMGGENNSGDIQVNGVSLTAATSSFTDGSAKITSGRGIKASDQGTNNVVIESELASA